jgi:hypothetical protein
MREQSLCVIGNVIRKPFAKDSGGCLATMWPTPSAACEFRNPPPRAFEEVCPKHRKIRREIPRVRPSQRQGGSGEAGGGVLRFSHE